MRFSFEQRFAAPLEQVEAALVDPRFLAALGDLPKLGGAHLLERREDGALVMLRVRYVFAGDLSAAVRSVVDPARLTWVEESTVDRSSHSTHWRIVPDHYANLLRSSGTYELHDLGAEGTRRAAEGEVRVALPIVGGRVERAIVSGLEKHAVLEEGLLGDWLTSSE